MSAAGFFFGATAAVLLKVGLQSHDDQHRLLPPWSVNEIGACFVVKDSNGKLRQISAPFSLAARWPHKNVFEEDTLIAAKKQSVAPRASNLAMVPTAGGFD